MLDILNELTPITSPQILDVQITNRIFNDCSSPGGTCSPFLDISRYVDPFSAAKTSSSYPITCPYGFHSLFNYPRIPMVAPWTDATFPSTTDKTVFEDCLDIMNSLYGRNKAITCLLDMLCECLPAITIWFVPGLNTSGKSYGGTRQRNTGDTFIYDMYLCRDKLTNPQYVRDVDHGEHLYWVFMNSFNIDLSIDHVGAEDYYFQPGFMIGTIMHELGHVLDHQHYTKYNGSHRHAYMWEAWYFLEIMRLGKPWISLLDPKVDPLYNYLDMPSNADCNTMAKRLLL